jgi:hypothetical protein
MGTPASSHLETLTKGVKVDLAGLYANLRKSPYKDNAVKSLNDAVIRLCDLIQEELSNHQQHPHESGVRGVLSSLRSVQGSMQLLITASKEYARTRNIDEKHKIEETWVNRELRLVEQADLCVRSLDVVLAFSDDLDSQAGSSEPSDETKAG